MKWDPEIWSYVLSTGTTVHANRGLLSPLNDDEDDLRLANGYDGTEIVTGEYATMPLTPAERKEIAAYMIQRWQDWADHK